MSPTGREPLDLLEWIKKGGLISAVGALIGGYLAWPEPAHAPLGSPIPVALSYVGKYQSHFYSKMSYGEGISAAIGAAALGDSSASGSSLRWHW